MSKNNERWVLAYVGFSRKQWCKVIVTGSKYDRAFVKFCDGSGESVWPVDELYLKPDLSLCEVVQEL